MTRLRCSIQISSALFRRSLSVATISVLLLASGCSFAVESAEGADARDLTFQVNVREVGIIFSAFGHHNRLVTDVSPQDVTVLDDGVPAQVTSVRAAELPIRLGMLIDASASLGRKLENEVSMATDFAERFLRAEDTASLMTFSSVPEPMVEVRSGADVQATLKPVDAAGLTAVYDSVIKGCAELNGPGAARKAVILLSDGDDTNSYHTRSQVLTVAERSGAIVYTIFVRTRTSGRDGERWMKRLADATGGRSFEASGPSDLEAALKEIERDIRSGYVLTFRPPTQVTDGNFHQVSIVPRQRDVSIRAQAGYVPK